MARIGVDLRDELIDSESELGPEVLEAFAALPQHSSAEERSYWAP